MCCSSVSLQLHKTSRPQVDLRFAQMVLAQDRTIVVHHLGFFMLAVRPLQFVFRNLMMLAVLPVSA